MNTRRRKLALSLTLAALGLVLPAASHAATFCVDSSACPQGGTAYADLDTALNAARNNVSADEILLGEGTYTGSFSYISNEKLVLRGESRAETIIRNPTGIALVLDGDDVTVTNLRIESEDNYAARLKGGTLDHVTVSSTGNDNTGVLAFGGSAVTNSTVTSQGGDAMRVTQESSGTEKILVTGSSLFGVSAGLRDVSTNPQNVEVTSSKLQGGSGVSFGEGKLVIRSSMVRGSTGLDLNGGADVTASNLTIDGQGTGTGVEIGTNSIDDSELDMTSSIISRFERAFLRTGSTSFAADVTVRYSLFQGILQSGSGSFQQSNNPTWAEPPFVAGNSLIPNLQLVAPSSLAIDGGEPGIGLGATDANGRPRLVDGDGAGGARVDLGAYEYQRSAPEVQVQAPSGAAPGASVTLSASSTDLDPTESGKHQFSWDLGDGSTSTGKQVVHVWPEPGVKTVTLTVSDPGGRSTVVTRQIKVGEAESGEPDDLVAPRISVFKPSAKRIRIGRAESAPALGKRGPQIRLRISERANVKLTFERRRGRKFRPLAGALGFDAAAGLNRLRFRGRISKRRNLGPGLYRVTAVATDLAGNRSAPATLKLTLFR